MIRKNDKTSNNISHLHQLTIGATAVLCEPIEVNATVIRLLEMGMTKGTTVTLIRRGPFGSPLQIALRGTYLCLRQSEAKLFPLDIVNAI